jgi:hypothetical protein
MQAILATGDADFRPERWLSPASAAGASSAYPGSVAEEGAQYTASKSSSNGTSTAESSSRGESSSLKGSVLQGSGELASELATVTEKSSISVAVASSPSHSAGGCPFGAMSFKQKEAQVTKKFLFGVGPRSCVGLNLAVTELVVYLIVLAREVKEVKISVEEQERKMSAVFPHPTGLPARFIPRSS